MHRGNRIRSTLITIALAASIGTALMTARPFVAGFERFHADQVSVEGGRLLFNELGCINCHQVDTGLPARKGPRLDGISHRIRHEWLEEFLENPQSKKPGTHMPDMGLRQTEATAIAHYLRSIESEKNRPKAFKFVNRERGKKLYQSIGCVACHGPDPFAIRSPDSRFVTIPDLQSKSDIHALSAYLHDPHATHPDGRMPRFPFEREDTGDIAAYLLNYSNGDSTEYPPIESKIANATLAAQGKEIFKEKSCTNCHDTGSPRNFSLKRNIPIRQLAIPALDHPKFDLSQSQSHSIDAFLLALRKTKRMGDAPAITNLQLHNCLACHERDEQGGPVSAWKEFFQGDPSLGDTGRYPPPLTDIGRKLKAPWLKEALAGQKEIRPYLKTRMPDFGDSASKLAKQLITKDAPSRKFGIKRKLAPHGRELLGSEGGLNCITCHSWKDRPSLGIAGMDLSSIHERLQPKWLHDFLIDPAAHRPNTLMPSFWPNGKASNQEILEGDTDSQIAAIYAYSKYGDRYPKGMPETDASGYELVPTDQPIIQRTFFEGIGTHAILVGFPEGMHLAIDGLTGRPAALWKGRFFDAYRTWFSRFPQFEAPLGELVIRWKSDEAKGLPQRFRGYRIDDAGIPEFISEVEGSLCYESLFPSLDERKAPVLERRLTFTAKAQIARYRITHPQGALVLEMLNESPLERRYQYKW